MVMDTYILCSYSMLFFYSVAISPRSFSVLPLAHNHRHDDNRRIADNKLKKDFKIKITSKFMASLL